MRIISNEDSQITLTVSEDELGITPKSVSVNLGPVSIEVPLTTPQKSKEQPKPIGSSSTIQNCEVSANGDAYIVGANHIATWSW